MQDFEKAKKKYEEIEIPDELNERVLEAVQKGRAQKAAYFSWRGVGRVAACLAGICIIGSTVAVNTSQAAAATLGELPVVGPVMKVLTVREYRYQDEDMAVLVEVPGISIQESQKQTVETNQQQAEPVQDINALIEQQVNAYTEQAKQHIAEYKEAFLATGGTEEEFQQKNIQVDVNYEVKSQSDEVVSFVITANENWSNAYGIQYFYNLNPSNGGEITLEDLLGQDYQTFANEQIAAQMKQRMANDSTVTYWIDDPQMGGFTGITEDVNFYVNEAGNPVIVFEKYEVAPGAMGRPEFEIVQSY